MNENDQTAPETPAKAPLTNMSEAQFAAHLTSKRQRPASSAPTGNTPPPAPAPESELAGSEEAQTPEFESNPSVEGQGEGQVEGSETPAASAEETIPALPGVHPEVLEAIRAAGIGADRAAAVAKMAKRIQAVVDDRDAERNRRLELERTLQEKPKSEQQQPAQAVPLTHPKLASLDTEINTIRAGLRTIAANRDGYTVKNEDGSDGRTFTAEELEEIRVENEARLAELSAERRMTQRELEQEEQAQRETATAEAERQYPWINQRESKEYQLAIAELRQLGPLAHQLKQSPAFALIVGRYVRGLQAEQADAARGATPAAGKAGARPSHGTVPPKVVPGSSSKAKVNPFAAKLKAAEEEMVRTNGSPKAYAQLRSLRRQAAAAAA